MAGTLLAVDIGNAVVQVGLARDGRLLARWELASTPAATEDEALLALDGFLRAAREGLAAPLGEALIDKIIFAVAHGVADLGAEAGLAESRQVAEALAVEPGRADGASLPIDRQMRTQFDIDPAESPCIVGFAAFCQIGGNAPHTILDALNESGAAQRFEAANVGGDKAVRIVLRRRLRTLDRDVMIGPIDAVLSEAGNGPVRRSFGRGTGFHDAADR